MAEDLAGQVESAEPEGPLELIQALSPLERTVLIATAPLLALQFGVLIKSGELVAGARWLGIDLPTMLEIIHSTGLGEGLDGGTWCEIFSQAKAGERKKVIHDPALKAWHTMWADDKLDPSQLTPDLFATADMGKAFKGNEGYREWCYGSLTPEELAVALGSPTAATKGKHLDKIKADGKMDWFAKGLSKGNAMPREVRAAFVRLMNETADLGILKRLFLKRFQKALKDSGGSDAQATSNWKPEVIKLLWRQLDVLPDSDCAPLLARYLAHFNATTGRGGTHAGDGDVGTLGTVQLGQDVDITTEEGKEKLAHTVRHEIGHAVHLEVEGQINKWIHGVMGFKPVTKDLATAVGHVGGWGTITKKADKDALLKGMRDHVGTGNSLDGPARGSLPNGAGGSFTKRSVFDDITVQIDGTDHDALNFADAKKKMADNAGKTVNFWWGGITPNQWYTPDKFEAKITEREGIAPDEAFKTLWEKLPESTQGLFTESPGRWWTNRKNYVKNGGKRWFWNRWYNNLFQMSDKANTVADSVSGDPDYTCMSDYEFFANTYAEYYKDPAGYTDNTKWGGGLPGDVQAIMKKVVLDREPYEAAKDASGGKGTPK